MTYSSVKKLRSALNGSEKLDASHELLNLSGGALKAFNAKWGSYARKDQMAPEGDWRVWLFLGGRGAGKTRAGAEWVRARALGEWPEGAPPARRIALVGPTLHDVRQVMVEGVSGLLQVHSDDERPVYEPSLRRLTWRNGAVAQIFSAEEPDSLRGPAFDAAWCDETAAWKYGLQTWQTLQFGMRLGESPRQMMTTTPRHCPLLKDVIAAPSTFISKAGTGDNAANLPTAFLDYVTERYAGTRLGRQELQGEWLEDNPQALWQRDMLERCRVAEAPELVRVVVAIDPPATSNEGASACGLVVAGVDREGRGYVLKDATMEQARPTAWAHEAVRLYEVHEADRVVAEVNQGGEMVAEMLRSVNAALPLTMVRATRGKHMRAEPVAALYEQGRVFHLGDMSQLEDRMCLTEAGAMAGASDMDRLDACVWALTELMLKPRGAEPRISLL